MNWKLVTIFSILLFSVNFLIGLVFGFMIARDEAVVSQAWFHLSQYILAFILETILFYLLFKQKIDRPINHALSITIITLIVSIALHHFFVGIPVPSVLIAIGIVLTFISIVIAFALVKITASKRIHA